MRFGKTLSALEVIKRCGFKKQSFLLIDQLSMMDGMRTLQRFL